MSEQVWYELNIYVKPEDKYQVGEILTALGEPNFVEGSVDCEIDFDYTKPQRDFVEEFARTSPMTVYGESLEHLQQLEIKVKDSLKTAGLKNKIELVPMQQQNWQESWKESFKPIVTEDGVFSILPPWENPEEFKTQHHIILDPGMAFGTGQHETTMVCLELLTEKLDKQWTKALDVGTGSGILAFALAKLGLPDTLGCDIEEDSVRIAKENAVENGVADTTRFTATLLEKIEEHDFDFIIANILRVPLELLLPDIVKRLKTGNLALFSGILDEEWHLFDQAAQKNGLTFVEKRKRNDWVGLIYQK